MYKDYRETVNRRSKPKPCILANLEIPARTYVRKKENMIFQSSFTDPHVVPDLNASLSSVEHEDVLKNTGNQTTLEPIDCHYMDKNH